MKSFSESYKAAGVDITAGYAAVELMKQHVARTMTPGAIGGLGGFGGLFELDMTGLTHPVLVSGTDGVGTKLKIAFLMDKHDTVGIDCVAMCVNDVITCGAKPLVFLDYIACGKNYPEKIASIVAGVAEGCVQAGAALVGGETAEMPGFYPEQEYDLAGFTVGVVEKSKIIDNTKMQAGDAVIALPSSGVHSNGFSLVRKIFNVEYADIWQHYDELSGTLGETLLTPTKIYVKPVLALMEQVDVRAVSHITGGGFYENIPRALAAGCVAKLEKKSLRMPPIFPLLQKVGKIPERDMFNTFNMGVGMAVVVPGDRADESVRILNVAVLVSGGGTNLQAILDAKATGALPHAKIALVLASKPGVYALERASKAGVPGIVVARKSYAAPEEYDAALLAALREHRIDVVVLAGFLSILGPSVIPAYPERILNVHPSLIPSFCGAGYYGLRVHEAALAKGVKVTGATVHFVNEVPDGGRILLQQAVDVLPGDTPETLQKRVMEQAEWKLLPRALAQLTEELDAADGPAAPRKEEKDMDHLSLAAELAVNTYPGRGIVLGRSEDGKSAVIAYFIMGRSANSRNRVFTAKDGGIITEAADPSKLEDPSLIIYAPVRVLGKTTIVTNGDQTDTIYDHLAAGKGFAKALRTRTFEPDSPNFTPRISGIVKVKDGAMKYKLSILKSDGGNADSVERFFFEYDQPVAGEGRFIHTYRCDGSPIPSFAGEPERVRLMGDIDTFTRMVWNSLNEDNKVSLFVRYIDLATGKTQDRIVNKYEKV